MSVRLGTVGKVRIVFVNTTNFAELSLVQCGDTVLGSQGRGLSCIEAVDTVALVGNQTAEGLHLLILDDGIESLHSK